MLDLVEKLEKNLIVEITNKKETFINEKNSNMKITENNKWCKLHRNDSHNSNYYMVLKTHTTEQLKQREESRKKNLTKKSTIVNRTIEKENHF